MKVFDVYKHPVHGYEAVKQGFSWPAFFFNVIWAFVKKMWGLGFILLAVMFILATIKVAAQESGNTAVELIMFLIQIAFSVFIGYKGNDWRRNYLIKKGYEKVATVNANSPNAAILSVSNNTNQSIDIEENSSK